MSQFWRINESNDNFLHQRHAELSPEVIAYIETSSTVQREKERRAREAAQRERETAQLFAQRRRLATRARQMAWACLGILLVLRIALPSFESLGTGVFDAYQRVFPRQVTRLPVVIVDIDDASLAALGRWPWPRPRLAQLIEATHRLGAQAIGLDIIMPEADSLSPHLLLAERQDVSPLVRDELARLPSNDTLLAQTLRQTPSVVARAGLIDSVPVSTPAREQTPVIILGETPVAHVQAYGSHLTNVPDIEDAAFGRGYLNDTRDADGVVRTMPLLLVVQGELAPTLALELLRVALGVNWYSVHGSRSGVRGIQLGESFIPTDPDGRIRLYFSPEYAIRHVSALSILQGTQAPESLANQIALIGATAVGVSDWAATPVATRVDGVAIQAQVIENILDGTRLIRLRSAVILEMGISLMVGLISLLVLPKVKLSWRIVMITGILMCMLVGSIGAFVLFRLLLDATFPLITMFVVLAIAAAGGGLSELESMKIQGRRLDQSRGPHVTESRN